MGGTKSATIIMGVAKAAVGVAKVAVGVAKSAVSVTSSNGAGGAEPANNGVIPAVPKQTVIIMGVATKRGKNKGELMEQNQDGLEYSSEEEGEDLKDTMLSIAKKGRKVSEGVSR